MHTIDLSPALESPPHPLDGGGASPSVDLLRLATAGSVDDGKSTLIGRLLYDTRSIFEDQLEALTGASRRQGGDALNLALLTDGLRAEREQNITIDVAYRYFATPRRKFILADTPGHLQYTRNMVTGASTAELAIVLVDARRGVLTQSKRHGFLCSLLGIPHMVVAVNKMDLVDFSEEVYGRIVAEYRAFAEKLSLGSLTFLPISALHGDNVVQESPNMRWYRGSTLLHHLESVHTGGTRNLVDLRFPVQYVIRPHQDYRGFAGRIASGTMMPGERIVVLPGGRTSRIRSIDSADGPLAESAAGDSVVVTIEDEIDVGRGDMIVRERNLPTVGSHLDAIVCWMGEQPLDPAVPYVLMHTTRQVTAFVPEVVYRIDVDTMHREASVTLSLNDIGRVQITTAKPLFFDPYAQNHATGSFILIDPRTQSTVAAGMIRGPARTAPPPGGEPAPGIYVSPDVVWEEHGVSRQEREARYGHKAAVVWLTGLSGAGKSTVARQLERRLFALGCRTLLLDGDQVRHGLCGDLGFSADDRRENLRRVGQVARLAFEQGSIVLCSFVSPVRADREWLRGLFPAGSFAEVHVDCGLDVCRQRDPKQLYARAERGEIPHFTGISSPYEAPDAPELRIDTSLLSPTDAAEAVLDFLGRTGVLPQDQRG